MTPTASVLLVRDTDAENERGREIRALSAGFDVVLREHGWTAVHYVEAAALPAAPLSRYDLVIVTMTAEWPIDLLRALRAFEGVVFVEGPVPPSFESYCGVHRAEAVPGPGPLSGPEGTWTFPGAGEVLSIRDDRGTHPAVLRRGRVLSSTFPILAALVRARRGGDPVRGTEPVEPALLRLFEQQLERYRPTTLGASDSPRIRQPRYGEILDVVTAERPMLAGYAAEEILTRISILTELISHFTTHKSLEQTTVADMGCGHGPFPLALAAVERPRRVIGVDIRAESIQGATDYAARLGLENAAFIEGDVLRADEAVQDADILLALNILYYLSLPQQLTAARACHRALAPGGSVIALVTNRKHRLDEFTGHRWVHRMPRALAHRYVRRKRIRHGYLDVRSPTPVELLRVYRAAGFEKVLVVDPDQIAPIARPMRYRKDRFVLVATRAVA